MEILLKRKDKEVESDVKLNLSENPVELGRGALLKCSAPKVSRKHAEIYINSGSKVMLKSMSKSPTFVIHKAEEKEISNGDELEIHDGDQISLLEDEYVYKVVFCVKKVSPSEPSDTVMIEEERHKADETVIIPSTVAPEVSSAVKIDVSPTQVQSESDEESGNEAEWEKISPDKVETVPKMDYVKPKNEETPETDAKSEEKQSADTRKRDLPNWMKQNEPSAKADNVSASSSAKPGRPRGRKPKSANEKQEESERVGPSNNGRAKRTATKKVDYSYSDDFIMDSDEVVESEEEEKPKGRQTGRPPLQGKKPVKRRKLSDDDYDEAKNSDDDSDWGGSRKKTPGRKPKGSPRGRKRVTGGSRQSVSEDSDGSAEESYVPRPSRRRSTQGSSQTPPAELTSTPRKKKEAKADKKESLEEDDEADAKQSNVDKNKTTDLSEKPTTSVELAKSPVKPKRRKICTFGAKCYRKNPQHKEEFCHPGDEDYRSGGEQENDEENEDDDRPECEYGTDCFRKNPDHRKEFSHTRPPVRRAAKKAIEQLENESGPNDYDFNDSFIDDETPLDPADEESDYSPSEDEEKPKKKKKKPQSKKKSVSDDDEVKDLVTEAKEFKQNRKMWEPAKP